MKRLMPLLASIVLVLAACGGGSESAPATQASATSPTRQTAVRLATQSPTWTWIAAERQAFTLAAPARVRYGQGSTWIERDLPAGPASCTNAFFGTDPLFGIVKQCETQGAPGPSAWSLLAAERQPFTLAAPARVRYGQGSTWIERDLPAGDGWCTNDFFGIDPLFGTVKQCETQGAAAPSAWSLLAAERQPFTLAAPARVRYGQGSTWIERDLTAGDGWCTNDFFGIDPLFGVVKQCDVLADAPPPPPPPSAGAAALMFSDLTSGPSSGNSDDSQPGQVAGQDGAIVTVWGKNLGTTRGTILVGGVPARVYAWHNATAPANLHVRHGMQMVAFQVPHQVPNGQTTIQALVGGVATNTLPFTVRGGSIHFVKSNGNDSSGDGSWSRPWAKVSKATSALAPGAIVYIGDGVWQNAPDGDRSTLDLDRDPAGLGTAALPKALVGYPGADARIGSADLNAWSTFVSGSPSPSTYWTVAKLRLMGRHVAASYHTGFRIVGNHVSAPRGDDQTGAIGGIDSANLFVLGNELTNIGYPGTSKLYHPMYIQSAERNTPPRLPASAGRQIAWNYLHDNHAFDGINLYREGSHSAYMTNTRVHDNVIVNQTGRGILIGTYLTGDDNHFYNNVIFNAGLGPPPAGPFANDPAFGYVCVDINAGAVGNPPTTIHFYNNTLVGCGFAGGPSNTAGMISVGNAYEFNLVFRNNLVVSSGFPFVTPYSTTRKTTARNNLWFGGGGPVPSPTAAEIFAGAVLGDPLLVDASGGDLRLRAGSAAVDRGDAAAPVPAADFDNVPRPQGAGIDIGAFERR